MNPPTPGPLCIPECQNGGTCASAGVCTCATGWSGARCHAGKSCVIIEYRISRCLTQITQQLYVRPPVRMVEHVLSQEPVLAPHIGEDPHVKKVPFIMQTSLDLHVPFADYVLISAVCDEGFCMNGGTCARHNFCICPEGWTGARCDRRKSIVARPLYESYTYMHSMHAHMNAVVCIASY